MRFILFLYEAATQSSCEVEEKNKNTAVTAVTPLAFYIWNRAVRIPLEGQVLQVKGGHTERDFKLAYNIIYSTTSS